MADPLWSSELYPASRAARRDEARKRRAKFVVEYDLAYDGGGGRWNGYHRNYFFARIAALYHLKISSWGGTAEIYPYPKPVPPPKVGPSRKKRGLFRGRR